MAWWAFSCRLGCGREWHAEHVELWERRSVIDFSQSDTHSVVLMCTVYSIEMEKKPRLVLWICYVKLKISSPVFYFFLHSDWFWLMLNVTIRKYFIMYESQWNVSLLMWINIYKHLLLKCCRFISVQPFCCGVLCALSRDWSTMWVWPGVFVHTHGLF